MLSLIIDGYYLFGFIQCEGSARLKPAIMLAD